MNRPKPIELKILQGNPGKRPIPDDAPRADGSIPDCPEHLKGEARNEWGRITDELNRLGVLSSVDRASLELYCTTYARWRKAEKALERGLMVKSPNGYKIPSPFLSVVNQCVAQMQRFLSEYGLTASSRAKVKVNKDKPETLADKLKAAVNE